MYYTYTLNYQFIKHVHVLYVYIKLQVYQTCTCIIHIHLITSLLYMYLQSPNPSARSSVFRFLSSFFHTLWLLSHISTSFLQNKMNLNLIHNMDLIYIKTTFISRTFINMGFRSKGFSQNLAQYDQNICMILYFIFKY